MNPSVREAPVPGAAPVAAPAGAPITAPASSGSAPEPVGPAADRVYRHLKHAFFEQVHPGGTLLNEGEVAAAVGVSRTPVREALLRLQAEGLVRVYPKKGALVLPMSAQDIDDVFAARTMVESFTARAAWVARGPLVPVLADHLRQMRETAAERRTTAFAAADGDFHTAIVDAAANPVISRFYSGLRERQLCIGLAVIRLSPERMRRSITEHAAILGALSDGNRKVFTELVATHTQDAHRTLLGLAAP